MAIVYGFLTARTSAGELETESSMDANHKNILNAMKHKIPYSPIRRNLPATR